MPPLNIDAEPLGIKHKTYNKHVKDAIASNKKLTQEFTNEKYDLDNLLNIDIAGHNKNVEYILSVFKSDDLLYISRALKASPWLVDDDYAHILNPKHLKEKIFPQLSTKACLKLTKFLKRNLRNEARLEEFYNSETDPKTATKWLVNCSVSFIETRIEKHVQYIELLDVMRLCDKSETIYEKLLTQLINGRGHNDVMPAATLYLLNKNTEKYLEALLKAPKYMITRFNAKATNVVMKNAFQRIRKDIKTYLRVLDNPTFVKYLKPEEILDFLYKQANDDDFFCEYKTSLFRYEQLQHFIKRLPKNQQFDLVKKLFIDKTIGEIDENTLKHDTEIYAQKRICTTVCERTPSYMWYTFAPFDIAFIEIKKFISVETNYYEKYSMLKLLINIAQESNNMENLKSLLIYFNKQHDKDRNDYKRDFIEQIISKTFVHAYDVDTWQEYNKILINMDVYKESKDEINFCIKSIILYLVINEKDIPEVIIKKFSFDVMTEFKSKMNKTHREKVFSFLYNYIKNKIDNQDIKDEDSFREAVTRIDSLLDLLQGWEKNLLDYPFAIEQVKALVKSRKDHSWKKDLTCLFFKNKSWRKYLFEESLYLYANQNACINALKHDPALLQRHQKQVELLKRDDKSSLSKVNQKLRVYWPNGMAAEWTQSYLSRLNESTGYTATVRGLFTLLPQNPLSEIIKKYAPVNPKIDWNKMDEATLGLQRAIAKNMHIARPQPTPESILLYAKGDYLQYAVPSLHAIFYNLSQRNCQDSIPKLLNAPVSLQKHGLRFAFLKLEQDELKQYLSSIWNETQNVSIRSVIFELTFHLLCKEKDDNRITSLWQLFEVFLNNLTFKEDKKIYQLLHQVDELPRTIRASFLMKSHNFLTDLFNETKEEEYKFKMDTLKNYTREVMKDMDSAFMEKLIEEFVNNNFFEYEGKYLSTVSSHSGLVRVITAYILCADDEQRQKEKYDKIIVPIINRSFDNWNEFKEDNYYIRRHFLQLLRSFTTDLKEYVHKNRLPIPTKIYKDILTKLQTLSISENYLMLTMFKLTVRFAELIQKHNNEEWETVCKNISQELSKDCLEYLRQDVEEFFPSIYMLFAKAMDMALDDILPSDVKINICRLLLDDNFPQSYLTVIQILPTYYSSDDEGTAKIKEIILEHPSAEIKMHGYNKYKKEEV